MNSFNVQTQVLLIGSFGFVCLWYCSHPHNCWDLELDDEVRWANKHEQSDDQTGRKQADSFIYLLSLCLGVNPKLSTPKMLVIIPNFRGKLCASSMEGQHWSRKSVCKLYWMFSTESLGNHFAACVCFVFQISLAHLRVGLQHVWKLRKKVDLELRLSCQTPVPEVKKA